MSKEAHVELWTWYKTKDNVTFLRVAEDFKEPGTNQMRYCIQEYRNNLIMDHGLTRSQARRYILDFCVVNR